MSFDFDETKVKERNNSYSDTWWDDSNSRPLSSRSQSTDRSSVTSSRWSEAGDGQDHDRPKVQADWKSGNVSDSADKSSESSGSLEYGDVEAGLAITEKTDAPGKKDPDLVTWSGPNDPQNPKNWSIRRKWAATIIVGLFTLISPVASSMPAPALTTIAADFGIDNDLESQLVLSIFVLAYSFGPLFLGPLSEVFGRIPVLQTSNAFFAIFNLACGFAQNKSQMIAFRFLSGLGGSAPLAIGGAVIGDCWHAHERGRAIAIFSSMPLLATALGPLTGGFVVEYSTWRWIFYSITIACTLIQLAGLFFLKESFAPQILRKKRNDLIAKTGNTILHTMYDDHELSLAAHLSRALERPFRLLFTQPIVQFMAFYIAYVYGLIYLVMSTFPQLWSSPEYYNESIGISGLNYLSLGLGYFLGGQVCATFNDRIYRRLKTKNEDIGISEFRLPLSLPAIIVMPLGLLWYGWTAETHQHFMLPNLGAFFYSLGSIIIFQCLQTYLVDAYTTYAASALAAAVVLRSLCGFGFPLFAPYMYNALGYGWGNSTLAFVALVIGIPAPVVLWKYGPILRARSTFCAGD